VGPLVGDRFVMDDQVLMNQGRSQSTHRNRTANRLDIDGRLFGDNVRLGGACVQVTCGQVCFTAACVVKGQVLAGSRDQSHDPVGKPPAPKRPHGAVRTRKTV
jgi:hypothetical protein